MQKFQIVVTYHEGDNEMGLQASTICEIFDFLRIFLKTHKEKENGRNWGREILTKSTTFPYISALS